MKLAGSIFYLKPLMKLNEYEEAYNVVNGYVNKNISKVLVLIII